RAVEKKQRKNISWLSGLSVVHDRRIGGLAIPLVQRGNKAATSCFRVGFWRGSSRRHAPTAARLLLRLCVLEIIYGPDQRQPTLGSRKAPLSRMNRPQQHHRMVFETHVRVR